MLYHLRLALKSRSKASLAAPADRDDVTQAAVLENPATVCLKAPEMPCGQMRVKAWPQGSAWLAWRGEAPGPDPPGR